MCFTVVLLDIVWSYIVQNDIAWNCVILHSKVWYCMVLTCIDTIEVILSDWHYTAAWPSEN